MSNSLSINNLHVRVEDAEILHGISLEIQPGEIHVVMGPNGSGKSTLAQTIFGHPSYTVTEGSIAFNGTPIHELSPDKRANMGLFLAFQNPQSVPGVRIDSFLKQVVNARRRADDPKYKGMKIREYRELLQGTMDELKMKQEFGQRYLNDGFSGGEKKKAEILQMAMLKPQYAVLDEIDSGLDVDALRVVAGQIRELQQELNMGLLVITHYPRILKELQPDVVHVMRGGSIVQTGGAQLAHDIEEKGFDWIV